MNWNRIARRFAVILVVSALGALVAAAFAGDSWTWSDRLGFGAFLITFGLGAITMVWGHRIHQL
jgi:uncharacterized membrane protein (DUF485 family)